GGRPALLRVQGLPPLEPLQAYRGPDGPPGVTTDPGGGRPPPPRQEGTAMLLRHATPARNLNSILRGGLLCSHSKGKLRVGWAGSPARSGWGILRVIKRHGGRVESTVVLELDVPRSWLRRHKKRLWFCPRDVPTDRIRRVLTFQELAGSPVEETVRR